MKFNEDQIYSDSEISGSDAHRDAYQRLLAGARAKAFDAIIVESQDRHWRNQAEMHTALRKLTFGGIKVFSVTTGADLTDKAGKLIATILGWKDEAYLDDLRDCATYVRKNATQYALENHYGGDSQWRLPEDAGARFIV